MRQHFCLLLFMITSVALNAQVNKEAAMHFNEAVIAFKSNDYEGAITAYGKAIGVFGSL